MYNLLLADIIAVIHVGYIIFVVLGFMLIVLGITIFKWKWIRNLWFRIAHALAIVAVALVSFLGSDCPLTAIEFELRHASNNTAGNLSFIGNIIDSIIFYNTPRWLFNVVYTAFALIVLITFIIAPPSRKNHVEHPRCQ
ncbi:MAG TPA: DUF2784 domain-containing protein [Desulfatiglandales bacterium]|nr:DUF2784 domain-containing protein [Desulfatiglandales bacterium]